VVNLTTVGQLDAQATNKIRQAIREALRAEGRPAVV
jgi:anti-anti-sigma regulatory factor